MGIHCRKPRGQRAGARFVFTIEGVHDVQISTGRGHTILCATKLTHSDPGNCRAMSATFARGEVPLDWRDPRQTQLRTDRAMAPSRCTCSKHLTREKMKSIPFVGFGKK